VSRYFFFPIRHAPCANVLGFIVLPTQTSGCRDHRLKHSLARRLPRIFQLHWALTRKFLEFSYEKDGETAFFALVMLHVLPRELTFPRTAWRSRVLTASIKTSTIVGDHYLSASYCDRISLMTALIQKPPINRSGCFFSKWLFTSTTALTTARIQTEIFPFLEFVTSIAMSNWLLSVHRISTSPTQLSLPSSHKTNGGREARSYLDRIDMCIIFLFMEGFLLSSNGSQGLSELD